MEIKEYIHSKRPTLGKSSLTTYASILKSLYSKVFGDGKIEWDKFKDSEKILHFLKDVPANRRKTILSALVVITDLKEYKEMMMKDVSSYNKELATQTPTEEQKDNWIKPQQIMDIFTDLKTRADVLFKKKTAHTPSELQQIQNYIIVALLSGIFVPPRRSKDFCDFKIKNIEQNKDNFLLKNEMVFNSYKTMRTYGTQKIQIPTALKSILTKWIRINPTEWLLFDANMNHLTPVKLNQRFNKIFGGKISVNNFRHTYLTDKYGEHNKIDQEMAKDASEMGTSKGMVLGTYVKNVE
jgi:hypothetical protein